jgi:hypothetical protein
MELLTRDKFRHSVFERDGHKCVICGDNKFPPDAHHIIERRLFDDGGYYIDNGATLCGQHHILAEQTLLSCDMIREKAGIDNIVLPPHLYRDNVYDKWGNIILPTGQRVRGELFYDESVQKILKPVLGKFSKYVKYPRTYHLPWSPSYTKDDRVLEDISQFVQFGTNRPYRVIVTAKMDGENTTMYDDYVHARSLESDSHMSRDWVKNLQGCIGHNIPDGWRICGENLYAKHAIHYQNLEDYFQVFSIWNEKNKCLSWDETKVYCELLGLKTVPVIYDGLWDINEINDRYDKYKINNEDEVEGYVVRIADSFSYGQFRNSVAKFVRENHVQDVVHNWKYQPIIQNKTWKDNNKVR